MEAIMTRIDEFRGIMDMYLLSRRDVAEICGVSKRTVGKWIEGESIPYSSYKLLRIWAGVDEPPRKDECDEIFREAKEYMDSLYISLEDFTSRHLHMSRDRFFKEKHNNPEELARIVQEAIR